jgi:hypothetical protein
MATIDKQGDELVVTLTAAEKAFALRGGIRVAAAHVADVTVVPEGIKAVRGLRAPGLGLPGVRAVGTWRRRGWKEFVSVRRGQPALRITLDGPGFDSLLIGTDDPAATRAVLGLDATIARGG